ncbi:MAG: hypothetical protein ACRCY9_21365 [Phycicoccus sp.]
MAAVPVALELVERARVEQKGESIMGRAAVQAGVRGQEVAYDRSSGRTRPGTGRRRCGVVPRGVVGEC